MINARSIATLGIGFGIVAISTLGFVSPEPAHAEAPYQSAYGGTGFVQGTKSYKDYGWKRDDQEVNNQARRNRQIVDFVIKFTTEHL